ncbi:uncharacterized protein F5147DRAFT_271264 [Suillus discolor]|uniref:Uncharacterized protein n=1 Tax=Suillus discolor TaxID=1912936 RepID=A0A9P7JS39_9AGAM|nr:uncharacterized protein F5147DRAFT_271264 [Suillus discolor]KAG2104050.1 hypothetical protein F5147DRAFT_271264 [Suillus discolor]
MARHTRSRGSRKSLSQRQGPPVLVRRPSQASIDSLCHPRLPVRYLHAGLKMNPQVCCKTQRMIRELALRHIDFSIPYLEQPQSKLDFFKREVLLDAELSHLMRYEDAWAVEVFLGMMYRRPRIMRNLQRLDSELQVTQPDHQRQSNVDSIDPATQPEDVQDECPSQVSLTVFSGNHNTQPEDIQHDRPHHISFAIFSDDRDTQPEDVQHDLVCSDYQATQPKDNQVNMVQNGGASDTTSCLALLSTLLASMPGLHRFHAILTEAGLSTDEHVHHFFQMSSTGRERFITQALKETSTLFERVLIMEILEELRSGILVGSL